MNCDVGLKNTKGTSCTVMQGADLAGGGTINDGTLAITDSEKQCCYYCDRTEGMPPALLASSTVMQL